MIKQKIRNLNQTVNGRVWRFQSTDEFDTQKDACFLIVNAKRFLLRCVWGAGVSRDVVLCVRSGPDLVPPNRHGVESHLFCVCAARESRAAADDVSRANGAATCSIPAAVSQGAAAITAALGRSCSNHHRQQSGRQRPRQRRPVALGPADDRALYANACTVRRKRRDHLRSHQRALPSWPAAHRDQRCVRT